jgi:hypothetical protein
MWELISTSIKVVSSKYVCFMPMVFEIVTNNSVKEKPSYIIFLFSKLSQSDIGAKIYY